MAAFPTGWTVLPPLVAGQDAWAWAISTDRTTAIGSAQDSDGNDHAVIWAASGGIVDLGFLPGGTFSEGFGVSDNGSVVIGQADTTGGNNRAFVWTVGTGMVDITGGAFPTNSGIGIAVSSDGTAVTGQVGTSAFRWTSGGLVSLPGSSTSLVSISADGATVVGEDGTSHIWRWTSGTGRVDLGAMLTTSGGTTSGPVVANDGSVRYVGGVAFAPGDPDAAILYEVAPTPTLTSIGLLPDADVADGAGSQAYVCTPNGAVVVGNGDQTADFVVAAFVWTPSGGLVIVPAPDTYKNPTPSSLPGGITRDGAAFAGTVQDDSSQFFATVYVIPVIASTQSPQSVMMVAS